MLEERELRVARAICGVLTARVTYKLMSNRRRNVVRAIAAVGTLVVVSALADAGGAATLRPAAPQFATVKLKASAGRSEPRLAVGQRGRV